MLKKINRVTKKNDFDKIFKQGRSAFGSVLGIKALKNRLAYSRFGVIVSQKVSKKATARNTVKRRIREAVKNNLNRIEPGYDYIIVALPPVVKEDYRGIEAAALFCLRKLRLIKKTAEKV